MKLTGDSYTSTLLPLRDWFSSWFGHNGQVVQGHQTIIIALSIASAVFLVIAFRLALKIRRQRLTIRSLNSKLHGQSVRRGYLSEALAPLLDHFPVAVGKAGTTTLFLGQPVDYLHFDENEGVTFVEIKSGKATLNSRQRRLRSLVEQGQVRWVTMNVDTSSSHDA